MMKNPELSIILPVYCAEKYIELCINSILQQEYNDFELIIIDDGSKDDSLKICKKYETTDRRIKVFSQENKGRCKARNLGINISRGKYIAFVDNDDYVNKHFYKDAIKQMKKNSADIFCADRERVFNLEMIDNSTKRNDKIQLLHGDDILNNYFDKSNYTNEITVNIWDKVYKKELFDGISFENETFDDVNIMYLLLNKCNTVITSGSKYYYKNEINEASYSKKN